MYEPPHDFCELARSIAGPLIELRHDLHSHPELGFAEHRTAGAVLERLGAIPNWRVRTGLGGTGLVAVLNAGHDGPCVGLRADMDALPIQEATGRPYASTAQGRMHACGHDGHIACLVGAAAVLSKVAADLPGKVKLIFQPAEEGGGGASKMIEHGALDDPKVDALFGLHGWPDVPLGSIAIASGPVMAGTRSFDLIVRGKGTHAAYPHLGTDVIAAASQIVTDLQAIRSRRVDPIEPLVISICQMTAGETYNVLPEVCTMKGTIRALSGSTLESAWEQVQQLASATAAGFGADVSFHVRDAYPPLVNDARCTALVEEVGRSLLGPRQVVTDPPASMGGEDFAYYCQRVPAALFRLGLRPPDTDAYPALHNPHYDFNDDAIPIGVALHCGLAHRFLADPPSTACG